MTINHGLLSLTVTMTIDHLSCRFLPNWSQVKRIVRITSEIARFRNVRFAGNFCRPPPIINNFAQLRLLRRLDNGTLARVQPQQFIHNDIAEYVCRPGFTSPSTSNYNYCHGRKGWTRSAECICK